MGHEGDGSFKTCSAGRVTFQVSSTPANWASRTTRTSNDAPDTRPCDFRTMCSLVDRRTSKRCTAPCAERLQHDVRFTRAAEGCHDDVPLSRPIGTTARTGTPGPSAPARSATTRSLVECSAPARPVYSQGRRARPLAVKWYLDKVRLSILDMSLLVNNHRL